MLDLQPVVICNHKLQSRSLLFYVGKEVVEQTGYVEEISVVLGECDNIKTIRQIVAKLKDVISQDEILQIFEWLLNEKIVVDARKLFTVQHQLSKYPDLYPTILEETQVKSLDLEPPENLILIPTIQSHLLKTISSRKSTRCFSKDSVSFEILGGLLSAMSLVDGKRSFASAGAIYPLNLYLHVFRNGPIPTGTYFFDSANLGLIPQRQVQTEILKYALDNDQDLEKGYLLFVTADLSLHTQKYSNRGYNYTLMDVGASCSNAYIFAAENNFGICQYGGFDPDILKDSLLLQQFVEVMAVLRFGCEEKNQIDATDRTNKQIVYLEQKLSKLTDLKENTRRLEFEGKSMGYWATSTQFNLSNGDVAGGNGVSYSSTMSKLKSYAEIFERLKSGHYRFDVRCPATQLDSWLDPRIEFPVHQDFAVEFNLRSFNPNESQDWIVGNRLRSNQEVHVPTDCIFYPMPNDYQICVGITSNGVAAGQTFESAASAALFELIERDAIMISWYSQQPVKKIPEEFLDSYLQHKITFWKGIGRKLEFFDFTLDTIPVIVATISGNDYPMFVKGSSANTDFLKACHKALQEVEITAHSLTHSHILLPIKPEEVVEVDDH